MTYGMMGIQGQSERRQPPGYTEHELISPTTLSHLPMNMQAIKHFKRQNNKAKQVKPPFLILLLSAKSHEVRRGQKRPTSRISNAHHLPTLQKCSA